MALPLSASVVLFDGVCNFCNAWVRFVVRHDSAAIFRFAAQQSPIDQAMIGEHPSGPGQLFTVILIAGDSVYTESSVVLERYARGLVHLGRGSHYCGLFRVHFVILATAYSPGIGTDGLGGLTHVSRDLRLARQFDRRQELSR